MSRILVTGATGFIGSALCAELARSGDEVVAATRAAVGDITQARWEKPLEGVQAVIHLAAAVHARHAEALYEAVNVAASERLALAAARAGARRFVFVSTIKVNGERTSAERPFAAADAPAPEDAYGGSKWRAEQRLAEIAAKTGLELAVVRPPLVYGPGVKANFLRLVRLVDSRVPLPFASIRNRRSLVYVGNLVSLLALCARAPQAAGKTFLAADGDDMSTPQLARRIGAALGFAPWLVPFPPALLPRQLSGSLAVDASETRRVLGWTPPFSVDEGLAKTVAAIRA